ncbi:unnamed protein product [Spirodela intermedia]|uniref:RING-type E3 ubiquitin transferase n=1 Tax=Spirodela intermedia TaxID=51605 RepID=A0A7I8KWC0_SPIIN|nr:unnamed protein product [Spirodela intermedia]
MTAVWLRGGHGGGFAQVGRRRHANPVRLSSFLLLLLFAFLSGGAEAQPLGPNSGGGYSMNATRFNPSMAIIVVVLISVFFVMGFFSIYIRQCTERGDLSINLNTPGRGVHGARQPRGLDPAVIETFPMLVYADVKDHKISKGALECAVCLSEFDGGDTLRLLPKCDHVFHANCIDAWLLAHTTCPVCRADLVPNPNEPPPIISAAADANGAAPTATSDERQGAVPPENPGDNQSDQVAITIDEPARPEPAQRKAGLPPLPPAVERTNGIGTEGKARSPWWSKSSSSVRAARLPRSHSTGHSMTIVPPAADCDRYTLRLPEHIRRDVMAGKLRRSSSFATFPAAGDGSVRKGHGGGGGEGSSRGGGSVGGRSFKLRRPEWAAKPDRWSFFARTFSTKSPKGGGDGAGEGSTRRGTEVGDQPGDGSVKAKPFATVRSPFDCLGVGGGGDDGGAAGKEDARRPLAHDHSSHC